MVDDVGNKMNVQQEEEVKNKGVGFNNEVGSKMQDKVVENKNIKENVDDKTKVDINKETETVKEKINIKELIGNFTMKKKKLEEEIDKLEKEKDNYCHRLLRLQADFDNFRKRTMRENSKRVLKAKVDFISELLPVLDNFERALAVDINKEYKKGVEMIYRQMVNFFEIQGIKSISTVNEQFDPNLHEALMQVETEEYESGLIVEELQKGYILEDIVIRPAKVKVAQ